ncbi:hypothetical protein PAAG_07324 [Paracoccidioides lutzii Pb01]|uniref:Uncharacterized protein n=1 Tax=Paracoccidioides lutzii (strain ATCC MYA-826 / Pb01) TaxID=502779 RepID=C1H983_PARBA|nr:hypothetical protein PAAG_07324 [Paracoccidioides lutzii Pb01]EEH36906.2 hypothetical protein PAAG_07324 [Paracoccidioides lutzii Pb01]
MLANDYRKSRGQNILARRGRRVKIHFVRFDRSKWDEIGIFINDTCFVQSSLMSNLQNIVSNAMYFIPGKTLFAKAGLVPPPYKAKVFESDKWLEICFHIFDDWARN